MSGEVDMSTYPIASAVTSKTIEMESAAPFCNIGAEPIRFFFYVLLGVFSAASISVVKLAYVAALASDVLMKSRRLKVFFIVLTFLKLLVL
jgi:hypothetical protein